VLKSCQVGFVEQIFCLFHEVVGEEISVRFILLERACEGQAGSAMEDGKRAEKMHDGILR